nr:tripartite motif-containing protein 16 [Danio rerio]|eukprot:XP_005163616.2 tripartite motif-containing protein 16 [Danio rerio]
MAESSTSVVEDQFSCSICKDLLREPVTIPCGHSYCMICITDCWSQDEQRRVYSCPQCRQTFTPRPALNKNVVMAEMVENLKKTGLKSRANYAEAGDVKCDVCAGRKRKAVKSCLLCLNSYCETHFECHEVFHSSKRHKVTDATGRIQEMICSQHDRLLEVYCRTDQKCVCLMCVMDEHKNHDTVSAEAERAEKQIQVGETQTQLQNRIQEKQSKLQQLRESVEIHKSSAQTAVDDCERIFTEIIRCIKRRRLKVTQMIRDREKTEVSRAEGLLKKVEQEIEDLKRRNTELEQLSHTDDHIHFLQSLQPLIIPAESTDSMTVSSLPSYEDVGKSVSELRKKLDDFCKEQIKLISASVRCRTQILPTTKPKTREDFLKYFHQFTLDSQSVHNNLSLSDENRVATFTASMHAYPDHPDKFDTWPQVLCRENVCGRCYWEVEWSGNHGVAIAVSYKSISRKGQGTECKFGYNNQSWRLFCSASGYIFSHNNRKRDLPVVSKIGVYVDQRAGVLSFFRVSDTKMSLIHRVQTTFTQPLYPGFGLNRDSSVKLSSMI